MTERKRCVDCDLRYAVGRSPRCKICKRRNDRRTRHNAHLKKTYGITIEDYDYLLAAQEEGCWICRGGTSKHFFQVDHCHKTGVVRGLLCANCNKRILAAAKDNPEVLRRAADYLEIKPAVGIIGEHIVPDQ